MIPACARCCLAALALAVALNSPAAAATYQFSGTHDWMGGPPPSDLFPGFDVGDPFAGTITFDEYAPGGPTSYPGAPLGFTLWFDGVYEVNWETPASGDQITFVPASFPNSSLIRFEKAGTPSGSSPFNNVQVTSLYFDLHYGANPLPGGLSAVDMTAPGVTGAMLAITLSGPGQWEGAPEEPITVFMALAITEITAVPEPATWSLATLGLIGLGMAALRITATKAASRRGGLPASSPALPNAVDADRSE